LNCKYRLLFRGKGFNASGRYCRKIANALGVSVEYLVTGQETPKKDILFDKNIRAIIQILNELNEKDIETILGLSKILKSQLEKDS